LDVRLSFALGTTAHRPCLSVRVAGDRQAGGTITQAGGKNYYRLLMSSEQRRDLVLDRTYQTIVRSADKAGDGNLLTGAGATFDASSFTAIRRFSIPSVSRDSNKWGSGGTIALAGLCVLDIIVTYAFIPERKGVPLE
jgi:hypothetical protein